MTLLSTLRERIEHRQATIGIIGLGYVGLPLSSTAVGSGHTVIGFDVSQRLIDNLNSGLARDGSPLDAGLAGAVRSGQFRATNDFTYLSQCDAIVICVPTPLSKLRDPDLTYVIAATKSVQAHLRPGQVVVLESTTYPGTTRDVVLPILTQTGLRLGEEYFLCFSPERVDPGNETWHTRNTPRLVGGMTPACAEIGEVLYGSIVDTIVPVSSVEVAELAKVYENTFRLVNIALANELAHVCSRLNLDVWDVINAASTKPFGFMRFTPGPGLGGHCIPVDPHYLSWKMESLDFKTRLIDLASEINAGMPNFVVELVGDALNDESRAIRGSNVVVLGVAYKKDIDDYRESPAIDILTLLAAKGANVSFHDPFCPVVSDERLMVNGSQRLESVPLTEELIRSAQAVVIATDHSTIDYGWLAEHAQLVIDTRGVTRDLTGPARIIGLSGKERTPETAPVA